ncbi:MAG: metalloregulator ArsR/SmtB family transcription factor [Eubacteriales bacterium]|nr:metalloregulator ArsR/SmtB family transcription factor [Eubacteriales bacterium]
MNDNRKTPAEIEEIKKELLEEKSFEKLSSFYSLFSDQTRLTLIALLARQELCVNDIAAILSMSQSRVSHQLAILRKHDIVTYYRKGKQVLYTLTDNHIKDIFSTGLEHISEQDEDIYQDKKKKGY